LPKPGDKLPKCQEQLKLGEIPQAVGEIGKIAQQVEKLPNSYKK